MLFDTVDTHFGIAESYYLLELHWYYNQMKDNFSNKYNQIIFTNISLTDI